jgi:hypothetical protein
LANEEHVEVVKNRSVRACVPKRAVNSASTAAAVSENSTSTANAAVMMDRWARMQNATRQEENH